MNRTFRAWRASFTRRWHKNYDLCDTTDYISGHQQRVAMLVLSFRPDTPRAVLVTAILHDQGEFATGDIAADVKADLPPEMQRVLALAEGREIVAQGFDLPQLSQSETRLLRMCDRLDAWLWMAKHAPHLKTRADWQETRDEILSLAGWLALQDEVVGVMGAA